MIVRTIVPTRAEKTAENPTGQQPIGTLIEHPDAWVLADNGLAIAVDEEAKKKLSGWKMKHARRAKAVPIVTLPDQQKASATVKAEAAPATESATTAKAQAVKDK